MLKNDPPPGTVVRFVREVRKARPQATATLIGSVRKYVTEGPLDEFEVDYRGERMIVARRDIELITPSRS